MHERSARRRRPARECGAPTLDKGEPASERASTLPRPPLAPSRAWSRGACGPSSVRCAPAVSSCGACLLPPWSSLRPLSAHLVLDRLDPQRRAHRWLALSFAGTDALDASAAGSVASLARILSSARGASLSPSVPLPPSGPQADPRLAPSQLPPHLPVEPTRTSCKSMAGILSASRASTRGRPSGSSASSTGSRGARASRLRWWAAAVRPIDLLWPLGQADEALAPARSLERARHVVLGRSFRVRRCQADLAHVRLVLAQHDLRSADLHQRCDGGDRLDLLPLLLGRARTAGRAGARPRLRRARRERRCVRPCSSPSSSPLECHEMQLTLGRPAATSLPDSRLSSSSARSSSCPTSPLCVAPSSAILARPLATTMS